MHEQSSVVIPPLRPIVLLAATLLFLVTTVRAAEVFDRLDLSPYQNQVVLVDFWASWCVPCRRSFPWMNEMQRKYRDRGLVVVAVNEDKEWAEAENFLADYPVDIHIVRDPEGDLARQYDLRAMPSSFLYDRSGKIAVRHYGFKVRDIASYEEAIVDLLDKPRPEVSPLKEGEE